MRYAPVLVVGPQRTGSTLVGRLFADAEGSAFTVNGKLFLYLLAFLPERNFADWSDHLRIDEIVGMLRRKPVLSPHPGFVSVVERHAADIARTIRPTAQDDRRAFLTEFLYRTYRTWQPRARFWGDKYNEYTLMLDDIADLFPDARFVFTHRSSKDAARSAMANFSDRSWQPKVLEDAMAKVEAWAEKIADFRSRRPDCESRLVRYADLLAHPHDVLAELEAFAGVSGLVRQVSRIGRDRRTDTVMAESG